MLDGLALKEAAARLGVANTTARTHLQRIFDKTGKKQVAEMLLNHATLKHSYANYEAELAKA